VLLELHVDLQPAGWRLVPRPGRDEQRARSLLARDLDALEEAADGYSGPLKLQVLGPWSLVAGLELERGGRALSDAGALRDVSASLAAGLAQHVDDVRARIPGVEEVVVQLDEPLLNAVLEGGLPTPSGWGRIAAVPEADAQDVLEGVLAAGGGGAGVRTGASVAGLLRRAGARFWGLDAAGIDTLDEVETAEGVEAGLGLMVGIAPDGAGARTLDSAAAPVRQLWRRVGLDAADGLAATILTPAEGLEFLDIGAAERAMKACRDAARYLADAVGGQER
jgi:hypothetical protein